MANEPPYDMGYSERVKPTNVVTLNMATTLNIDPDRILTAALNHDFKRVIVIGYIETPAGKEDIEYLAMSEGDLASVVWDLERAKHAIMRQADKPKV